MSEDAPELPPHDRMRGPVVERRGQVRDGSTTDQRLLDSRGSTDWLHSDTWRIVTADSLGVGDDDGLNCVRSDPAERADVTRSRPGESDA